MTQQRKGYVISRTTLTGSPYTTYWTPRETALRQRPNGSVVELRRLALRNFDLDGDGAAELFGLQLARILVEECFPATAT